MDPGAIFFGIPIVAILSGTFIKALRIIFGAQENRADRNYTATLEKRIVDLENRVLTLQDIVLSGEQDLRRKLMERDAHSTAYAPSSTAETIPPSPTLNSF
jgi:hypothetical protein